MHRLGMTMLLALLAGCGAMPKHHESRGADSAQIIFDAFPKGATIYVDGSARGTIDDDDATPIAVGAGTHDVEVRTGSHVVFERQVFIEKGTERHVSP